MNELQQMQAMLDANGILQRVTLEHDDVTTIPAMMLFRARNYLNREVKAILSDAS